MTTTAAVLSGGSRESAATLAVNVPVKSCDGDAAAAAGFVQRCRCYHLRSDYYLTLMLWDYAGVRLTTMAGFPLPPVTTGGAVTKVEESASCAPDRVTTCRAVCHATVDWPSCRCSTEAADHHDDDDANARRHGDAAGHARCADWRTMAAVETLGGDDGHAGDHDARDDLDADGDDCDAQWPLTAASLSVILQLILSECERRRRRHCC